MSRVRNSWSLATIACLLLITACIMFAVPMGAGGLAIEDLGLDAGQWTLNKDVRLSDGAWIPAGTPLTAEQLLQVVMTDDLIATPVAPAPEPPKPPAPAPSERETKEDPAKESFTVQFVDWNGVVLKSEQVEQGNDATPPQDPTRAGYSFEKWNRSYTNVTQDITVKALYVINSESQLTSGERRTAASPETTELLNILRDEGVPVYNILGADIPLHGGSQSDMVWAASNMVFAQISTMVAIFALSNAWRRKKAGEVFGPRKIWLLAAIFPGILSAALFALTQDTGKLMAIFDTWTIAYAAILITQLIALRYARKRDDENESQLFWETILPQK